MEMANGTNISMMALHDGKAGSYIKMADDKALKGTEKLLCHSVEEKCWSSDGQWTVVCIPLVRIAGNVNTVGLH